VAVLDQISWISVGYAVLVALVAAYAAWRWRERPPWLDSMAWMLEFLVALRAGAGLLALAGSDRPDELSAYLGYLVVSVCVVPLALGQVAEDRSAWSVGVVAVAAVAVAVISVRLVQTR
jgi:hypothetical protein